MASDLENSIRMAAETVAKYVADVASMSVETKYVEIGANGDVDFSQAKPVARTLIRLDGDSDEIIPLRQAENGRFEADADLMDIHRSNVQTTIDYRARLLDALLDVLRSRGL